MPTLSSVQFQLVYNSISFAIAAMGGAFVLNRANTPTAYEISGLVLSARYNNAPTIFILFHCMLTTFWLLAQIAKK